MSTFLIAVGIIIASVIGTIFLVGILVNSAIKDVVIKGIWK